MSEERKESDAPPEIVEDELPRKRVFEDNPGPVVIDDDEPDPEEVEREEAFGSEPVWNGVLLYPFSITRESIFYSLRAKMGAPSLSSVNEDPENFLADAMRILWLCSHDKEEIRPLRMNALVMQEAIEEWAEKTIPYERQLEASLLAMRIFNHSVINRPTTVEDGKSPGN